MGVNRESQCRIGLGLGGGGFVIAIVPLALQLWPLLDTVTLQTYVPGVV